MALLLLLYSIAGLYNIIDKVLLCIKPGSKVWTFSRYFTSVLGDPNHNLIQLSSGRLFIPPHSEPSRWKVFSHEKTLETRFFH
jgi:hypothetical protein